MTDSFALKIKSNYTNVDMILFRYSLWSDSYRFNATNERTIYRNDCDNIFSVSPYLLIWQLRPLLLTTLQNGVLYRATVMTRCRYLSIISSTTWSRISNSYVQLAGFIINKVVWAFWPRSWSNSFSFPLCHSNPHMYFMWHSQQIKRRMGSSLGINFLTLSFAFYYITDYNF